MSDPVKRRLRRQGHSSRESATDYPYTVLEILHYLAHPEEPLSFRRSEGGFFP
jgi:hypothetical protein